MQHFKQAVHLHSMRKRAKNRKAGNSALFTAGIPFISKNGGAHLIVNPGQPNRVDYWPGTGLWKATDGSVDGRGIESLLEHLRVCPSSQEPPAAR